MTAIESQNPATRIRWVCACAVFFLTVQFLFLGCNRKHYRKWADRDAYSLIESRQTNPDWLLPVRAIEPENVSRLADDYDLDCGPMPPDDPEANRLMRKPFRFHNNRYWDQIAEAPSIENSIWQNELPYNEDGEVELDRDSSIEIALLHSRDYQTRWEQLYLSALNLSSNRFEFETQWFGRTGTNYSGVGRNSLARRAISQDSAIGFSRQLAAGGQIAASLVNSLVWNLTPSGPTTSASNIVLNIAQPLMRGAFRNVRLESLTQSERSLLYDVRSFARFRRIFYLDITRTYLGLLTQTQSLRNQRANLSSLELNLEEYRLLFSQGDVSQLLVDQVFQEYQRGRISLLASEQDYADTLDNFKFRLGLPPQVDLKINLDFLEPFELSNPKFDVIRNDTDQIYLELVQYLPPAELPPDDLINKTFNEYARLQMDLESLVDPIELEWQRWSEKLQRLRVDDTLEPEEVLDVEQQVELIQRARVQLDEVKAEIRNDVSKLESQRATLATNTSEQNWTLLSKLIGRRLSSQTSTLFILQNQIRLFLIEATPFQIEQDAAIEMALASRLDLMNGRARVMDAWRGVEVAADALESDLDFTTTVTVGTDPSIPNPIRFDSSTSTAQVGLQFDSPVNRFNERNSYRAAQIQYQQARRDYMASEDNLINGLRSNLRQLRINKLNFQIARQSLIAATRQVEQTQLRVRSERSDDSSLTRDLLQALEGLLDAKNALIFSWINYEVARIELFVDLELLYLNDDGTWSNSQFNPGVQEPPSDDESVAPAFQPSPVSDDPAIEQNDRDRSGSLLGEPNAAERRHRDDYFRR